MASGLAPRAIHRSVANGSLTDLDASSSCSNDTPANTSQSTVSGGSGSVEGELLGVCNIPPYRGAGGSTDVHGDVMQPSGWVVQVASVTTKKPTCESEPLAGLNGTDPASAEFVTQTDSGVQLDESLTHSPKSSEIYLSLLLRPCALPVILISSVPSDSIPGLHAEGDLSTSGPTPLWRRECGLHPDHRRSQVRGRSTSQFSNGSSPDSTRQICDAPRL